VRHSSFQTDWTSTDAAAWFRSSAPPQSCTRSRLRDAATLTVGCKYFFAVTIENAGDSCATFRPCRQQPLGCYLGSEGFYLINDSAMYHGSVAQNLDSKFQRRRPIFLSIQKEPQINSKGAALVSREPPLRGALASPLIRYEFGRATESLIVFSGRQARI
jgi:hypothetical protein